MAEIFLDYEAFKSQTDKMAASHDELKTDVPVTSESSLPTVQAYLRALLDLRVVLKTYSALLERDSKWISDYADAIRAADNSSMAAGGSGGGGGNW